MHNIRLTHVNMLITYIIIITDVIAAIEVNSSAASDFDVQKFIRSNKPPGVVSSKLPDVFIDAKLSQFGPKGNFVLNILMYSNLGMYVWYVYIYTYVHTNAHT